ncbi:hypothetical protein Glove_522g92 [Diversispora epigaea]|uniref:Uncharacterized protein n=1 Tax=Diversispora epigaea TaxID=1348612 RepID=A0A397GEF9_9GLOM|nr:hypothetical protein Glove_522g92 [Diversispora epigaea]
MVCYEKAMPSSLKFDMGWGYEKWRSERYLGFIKIKESQQHNADWCKSCNVKALEKSLINEDIEIETNAAQSKEVIEWAPFDRFDKVK